MRSMIKRRYLYGVLCLLALVCTLFFFGCGTSLDSQSKQKDYGIEKTKNDAGLFYDAEENRIVWTHDGVASRYSVYLEDSQGETYVFRSGATEDLFVDEQGHFWVNAKDELQKFGDKMDKDVNVLLVAYGNSYEDPLWHLRVPYELYDAPVLRLSKETGDVVWGAVEGAKNYFVKVNYTEEYVTTETSFNILSMIEAGQALKISVRPMGEENGAWMSAECEEFSVNIAPSPIVDFRTRYLSWYGATTKNSDGERVDSFDYSYRLDIYDGEEHICVENVTAEETSSSTFRYPYMPKTDNFSFSVTATILKGRGCDDYLPSFPTVRTPEYKGAVEETTYNSETFCLEWEEIGRRSILTVDGQETYVDEESYSLKKWLQEGYEGALTIDILSDTDGDGYCTSATHTVIFPTALDIKVLESSTYEKMNLQVSGFDEWTTGCVVEKYDEGILADTKTFDLTDEQLSTNFDIATTEERVHHSIRVISTYPENLVVVPRENYASVYLHGTPTAREMRQGNEPTLEFQNVSGDLEVEYNGEITTCDNVYQLPAEIYETKEEKEFTIRVRATYFTYENSYWLPSLWKEYTICTLSVPENLRVENGTLYWDYVGQESIKYYKTSTGSLAWNEEWTILSYNSGEKDISVCALADNENAKETGVWYLNGRYSESVTVEKLSTISGLTHNDYGMTWDAIEKAEGYVIILKAEDMQETLTAKEPEFVASEYLKQFEKISVEVKVKGNGVTTLDSEYYSFYVTRNPGFTYSMKNTTDWDGYYSQIFWDYAVEGATFDYQLISPSGAVIDSAKGGSVGQTNAIRDATDRNPEGVLERGEYTLRIVTPAAPLNASTYYLKTGDEALDCWDKTVYKTRLELSVENGDLTVECFPKFTGKEYLMEYHTIYTSSSTGIYTFTKEQIKELFEDFELGTYTLGLGLETRAEEYAKHFAFESRADEYELVTAVKKAPTPIPTYSEYTPGSVYYDFTGVDNLFNAKLDTEKTVYSTVKVDAGVDIIEGMQYVFTSFLEDGTVWKTVETTDRVCVMELPEFGSIQVAIEADGLMENGAVYYQSSEAVALAIECYNIGLAPFIIEEGNLVVGFDCVQAESLELWLNGEYVATLKFGYNQDHYYTYTFDEPLQSGDVLELRGWWTKDDWERSADYYFIKPVP